MEEALDRMETKGGTAMRDAISMSMDYVKDKAKKDKKVLVVVTDGNDNTSNINLEDLMRKAQQSDVLIYSIGILSEEEPRESKKAKRALHDLAHSLRRAWIFIRRIWKKSTRKCRKSPTRFAINTRWRIRR